MKSRILDVIAVTVVAIVGLEFALKRNLAFSGNGAYPGNRGGGKDLHPGPVPDISPAERAASGRPSSPAAIPPRGWWAVIKRVVNQFTDHRLMAEAAGVTFYMLLAIFPAIAALVSLYGLFADPKSVSDQLGGVANFLPGGGIDIIKDQIGRVSAHGSGQLGVGLFFGLAISLWSSNQGTKAMFDVLNVVYDRRETRSYIRFTLITLLVTLCVLLFTLLALAAVVVLPIVLQFIGLGSDLELIITLLRWPVLLVVISLFLSVIYFIGPCRQHPHWRWVTPGGTFASVAWVLISVGFSYYVANFGSYNATYGSLGAAIGFMTWIWISVMVVLLGAELSAELEAQPAV